MSKDEIEELFENQDIKEVEENISIIDMLINLGAVSSKREAKEFISNGAISINGEKVQEIDLKINRNMFIENTYIIVKRGKKNYYIGKMKQ